MWLSSLEFPRLCILAFCLLSSVSNCTHFCSLLHNFRNLKSERVRILDCRFTEACSSEITYPSFSEVFNWGSRFSSSILHSCKTSVNDIKLPILKLLLLICFIRTSELLGYPRLQFEFTCLYTGVWRRIMHSKIELVKIHSIYDQLYTTSAEDWLL